MVLDFNAKGNLDPQLKQGSAIKLEVTLRGVRSNQPCDLDELNALMALPKRPDACVCARTIHARPLEECLKLGEQAHGTPCTDYYAEFHCTVGKQECQQHQRKTCANISSIDKSKSNTRIYVENSPFCEFWR